MSLAANDLKVIGETINARVVISGYGRCGIFVLSCCIDKDFVNFFYHRCYGVTVLLLEKEYQGDRGSLSYATSN